MNARCLFFYGLLTTDVILLSGCVTGTLWQSGEFANYHEPATPANLILYASGNSQDVLVEYDESRENSDRIKRRAYWMERNSSRVRHSHKPRFVSLKKSERLSSIPIRSAESADETSPETVYAVISTNGQSFVVHIEDGVRGPYELPVYADMSGRTKQVLLTPVTVTADLAIIGTFVALSAFSHSVVLPSDLWPQLTLGRKPDTCPP
jgi:hypothetical protein